MKTIYNLVKKIIAYNAAIESIIHKNEETVNERYYKMYRPEFLEDRWKTENIIETILEWKENGNNYNDIISSIYYTAEKEVENLISGLWDTHNPGRFGASMLDIDDYAGGAKVLDDYMMVIRNYWYNV